MQRIVSCAALAAALIIASSAAFASDPNLELMAGQTAPTESTKSIEVTGGYDSPVVVHATAFLSDGGAADQFYLSFGGGYVYGQNGGTCMMAPVNFPVGAEITAMYITYVDNYTSDMNVQLRRKYMTNDDASEVVAQVSTSGQSTSQTSSSTSAITNGLVANQYWGYFVNFCLPNTSDLQFVNARFYYTDG